MAQTGSFTVDNVGGDDAITIPVPCRKLTIREQGTPATTDYFVRAPYSNSAQFRKAAGEETVFEKHGVGLLQTGEIVGYLSTAVGSVTFNYICE